MALSVGLHHITVKCPSKKSHWFKLLQLIFAAWSNPPTPVHQLVKWSAYQAAVYIRLLSNIINDLQTFGLQRLEIEIRRHSPLHFPTCVRMWRLVGITHVVVVIVHLRALSPNWSSYTIWPSLLVAHISQKAAQLHITIISYENGLGDFTHTLSHINAHIPYVGGYMRTICNNEHYISENKFGL